MQPFRIKPHLYGTAIVALMVFIAMVLAIAGWYYQDRKKQLLKERLQVLSIVSLSKMKAVGAWRKERLDDARILSENRIFSQALAKLIETPGERDADRELKDWLHSLRENYGYLHSTLLDRKLRVIAGNGADEAKMGPLTRMHASESLESGTLVYVDFHSGPHYRSVHLDLIIPFHRLKGGTRNPVGSLVLRIDPSLELYPLIASWPVPSTSAESILVRREGNDIVYLSDSRHARRGRLLARVPLRDKQLSAVLSAGKSESVFETSGLDGTPVFMDVKHVPDSPWLLLTTIDRDELFAPIRKEAWLAGLVAAALIFSAGIGIEWLRRRRSELHSQALARDISERRRAEMAIREGERRLTTLISNLAGIVYRCKNDPEWPMEFVSDGCREIVGHSPEDIMGGQVKWGDLIVAEDRQRVWQDVQDALAENRPYQMVFRLRDAAGNLKWVWEKGSGVYDGNGTLLALEGFIMDVSERKRMELELRRSEARFRELSDMLPEVIFESDLTGKLTYANKDAFAKYGYAEDELADGIFIHQLVVPEDRLRLTAAMADKLSGRKTDPYGGEYTTLRKDGTPVPVIVYSKPIVQDGFPIGLRGIVVDITEQKDFETQIKAQAAQLRAIIDNLPFDFWAIGPDGRYFFQNSPSREIWGGFVGRLPDEIAPSREIAALWRENNMRAFAGEVVKEEVEYYAENGARTCINILAPMLDGNSVLGIIGVNIDITDQKRAEAQIRFQVSLLDQVRNAVIASDLQGRIVYWNRYAEVLYQWAAAEALGQHLTNFLIPQQSREAFRTVTGTLAAAGSWEGEVVARKKDGSLFTIFMTITTLADTEGNRTGYVGISVDISERLRLEEQLLHAQKMEAVGRLAGGVAHDFNNILTAILGYGQMLRDRQDPESISRRYAEHILSSAEKAADLTRSLLAFSRKEIINPKLIDLNDVIKKITHLLSRLIGEDIELRTDLLDMSLVVMADGGQIEQVLMNLATNARDAMPGGGKIVIETDIEYLDHETASLYGSGAPGHYVRISFTDTGIGIPEDAREKIFDPFYTTKEPGKGTGLGLSIVHGIVMQHNGCIRLESSHGTGTAFHIYLPSAREESMEGSVDSMKRAAGGHETILLAEDDAVLRELNRDILEAYGYRVIVAADGQEAIDRFVEHSEEIRLLMLDVIMPRKNGGAVYAEIAALSRDIKVLFASGYAADILGANVSVDGMNFISKPMTPYDLLTKVRDVLDGA